LVCMHTKKINSVNNIVVYGLQLLCVLIGTFRRKCKAAATNKWDPMKMQVGCFLVYEGQLLKTLHVLYIMHLRIPQTYR
jgi:hypothetical protein